MTTPELQTLARQLRESMACSPHLISGALSKAAGREVTWVETNELLAEPTHIRNAGCLGYMGWGKRK